MQRKFPVWTEYNGSYGEFFDRFKAFSGALFFTRNFLVEFVKHVYKRQKSVVYAIFLKLYIKLYKSKSSPCRRA